jgi:hypothetical protein
MSVGRGRRRSRHSHLRLLRGLRTELLARSGLKHKDRARPGSAIVDPDVRASRGIDSGSLRIGCMMAGGAGPPAALVKGGCMSRRRSIAATLGVFLMTLGLSGSRADERLPQPSQAALNKELSRLSHQFSQAEFARIIRGYRIAPVPLDLHGKDLALVGLGSYIVNAAGGCNDCHTSPPFAEGGDPFVGQDKAVNAARYLAGGTPFGDPTDPDTPVSRNLTPRANGLPANLTWPQFRQTIKTGEDLKNRRPFAPSEDKDLLQVMPWPVYQDLSDRDLRAIYEYLRAIPSLPSAPTP